MGIFTKDIKSMEDLLMYYAEQQIIKSLPKMIEKATSRDLVAGLKGHLEETNKQVERLQNVFEKLGKEPSGTHCPAIDGIIKEADKSGEYKTQYGRAAQGREQEGVERGLMRRSISAAALNCGPLRFCSIRTLRVDRILRRKDHATTEMTSHASDEPTKAAAILVSAVNEKAIAKASMPSARARRRPRPPFVGRFKPWGSNDAATVTSRA